jgi:ATP-binding cassette subfamily B protein/subfamily B ATP-binding cassette protein MsbA
MHKPLRHLARLSSQFSKASVSAERISEILAAETETPDLPNAVPAANLQGEIAFQRVSFQYNDGAPALRDVSFVVRAGQRVALVGASGAGKSTLASLLLRLYDPSGGTILLDNVPLKMYERESLRRELGVVLQDTILFGASIRENIAYGKPNATMVEIEAAARLAYAHDFINALPDGYDTVIGERGATLSGGQRQRLCLARAFLKQPSILLLDEPTSAIDAESAALIQQAMAQVQRDKTTLVIAHQFAFIKDFDLILLLRDGAIVERGTHAELLRQRGHYYELYRAQGEPEHTTIALPQPHPAQVNGEACGIYPLHV